MSELKTTTGGTVFGMGATENSPANGTQTAWLSEIPEKILTKTRI